MPKVRFNKTFFAKTFNPSKYKSEIDYDLLKEAFCKREEDIKQEEEDKKKLMNKTSKVTYVLD